MSAALTLSVIYTVITLWLVISAFKPLSSWYSTIIETLLMATWPIWWAITVLYFIGYGVFITGRMFWRKLNNVKQSIQSNQ